MGKRSSEYMPDEALLNDLAQPFPEQRELLPNGQVRFVEPKRHYALANPSHPINQDRDRIVDLMESGEPFIVQSPTGSGKTQELPKAALETGLYTDIWVTQPTIPAARMSAMRAAAELSALGADGERLVGYATAMEGNLQPSNRIRYVTDQKLAEMALSNSLGLRPLVINDEFHMGKLGGDLAFTICTSRGIQTIISSATIDAEFHARRAEEITGRPVPIVTGVGRRHPVEMRISGVGVSQTLLNLIEEYKDKGNEAPKGIIFLPGDKDIRDTHGRIHKRVPKELRLFHMTSESSQEHQQRAMANYKRGSVISGTNILETSLTVPDTDFVIDSGWQRTGIWKDGHKTLPLEPASKASRDQRQGRVGRTRPGIYIIAPLEGYPLLPFFHEPENAPTMGCLRTPRAIGHDTTASYELRESERVDLSDIELRLQAHGMSLETVPLMAQPSQRRIEQAKHHLRQIDAMHYGEDDISAIGKEMVKLNVDTSYARMVIEACRFGPRLTLQMIAAVAALQMKGIGATGLNRRQWLELTNEKESDVLAQLDLMVAAMPMNEKEKSAFSIIDHRFDRAVLLGRTLAERLDLDFDALAPPTEEERARLIECSIRGYHDIFVRRGKRTFNDKNKDRRTITGSSVIATRAELANIVLGEAIDIGAMSAKHGLRMRKTVKMATVVTVAMLDKTVPEKMSRRLAGYDFTQTGRLFGVQDIYYENMRIDSRRQLQIEPNVETDEVLVRGVCDKRRADGNHPQVKTLYKAIDGLYSLQDRCDDDLELDGLYAYFFDLLSERAPSKLTSIAEVAEIISEEDVKKFIPETRRAAIMDKSPDSVAITLEDDSPMLVDVTYRKNVAYVSVLPQIVEYLPNNLAVGSHKTLLKVQGVRNMLTVAQAKEHFGRGSRWYRRSGNQSGGTKAEWTDMTTESPESVAARTNVKIVANAETVIIVNHFTRKGQKGKSKK